MVKAGREGSARPTGMLSLQPGGVEVVPYLWRPPVTSKAGINHQEPLPVRRKTGVLQPPAGTRLGAPKDLILGGDLAARGKKQADSGAA